MLNRTNHQSIIFDILSQDIPGLRFCQPQTFALSNRIECQSPMLTNGLSIPINNWPRLHRLRCITIQERAVIAARQETQILAVLAISYRQPQPAGGLAHFRFEHAAKWKTCARQLRLG